MSRTVVLCGSLGSSSAMWETQLPVLHDRRIVKVDHPGHGGAPARDVGSMQELAAIALEQAGGESFSFVGLSLGAAVGMQLARDEPGQVEKLVVACASPRFGEPQQWADRAATVRANGLEAIVDAVLARWFTPEFGDTGRFRTMFLATDAESYAGCCEVLAGWDMTGDLGRIEADTLVIAGAEDPTSPPAHGEVLAAGIPGARFEVIEGAAHLANAERPDVFNRLLEEHL
jgi:3-oxoadipate enol-lactonase